MKCIALLQLAVIVLLLLIISSTTDGRGVGLIITTHSQQRACQKRNNTPESFDLPFESCGGCVGSVAIVTSIEWAPED